MTGFLWAAVGVAGTLGMTAIGDMVSEEVRDRLDHLPHAILRLAAMQLDEAERSVFYEEVWLPDLAYTLKGDEARPVTRLIDGTWYALGILLSARQSARYLRQARSAASQVGTTRTAEDASVAASLTASQVSALRIFRALFICTTGFCAIIYIDALVTMPSIYTAIAVCGATLLAVPWARFCYRRGCQVITRPAR